MGDQAFGTILVIAITGFFLLIGVIYSIYCLYILLRNNDKRKVFLPGNEEEDNQTIFRPKIKNPTNKKSDS
ncbi:MAG: hypothetical protein LBM13_04245 [Candidatus Ancillula sp.]|jgi:hypothetical protein|nr:hypothetical protein [Candidatus Ancillula sp.]